MRIRPVAALARYAMATNLRTPHTWAGFGLMAVVTCLGVLASARDGLGWTLHSGFLTAGGLLAALFAIRSGLVAQREGGLQTYLRRNFVSPLEDVAGAALALVGSWLLVAVGAVVLAGVLPGADPGLAAWLGWVLALQLAVFLPFILATELLTTLEVPFLVPGLLWLAIFLGVWAVVDAEAAVRFLLPGTVPRSFASTGPLIHRALLVNGVGFAAILAGAKIESRRRP